MPRLPTDRTGRNASLGRYGRSLKRRGSVLRAEHGVLPHCGWRIISRQGAALGLQGDPQPPRWPPPRRSPSPVPEPRPRTGAGVHGLVDGLFVFGSRPTLGNSAGPGAPHLNRCPADVAALVTVGGGRQRRKGLQRKRGASESPPGSARRRGHGIELPCQVDRQRFRHRPTAVPAHGFPGAQGLGVIAAQDPHPIHSLRRGQVERPIDVISTNVGVVAQLEEPGLFLRRHSEFSGGSS
jgi:hypothetical protein